MEEYAGCEAIAVAKEEPAGRTGGCLIETVRGFWGIQEVWVTLLPRLSLFSVAFLILSSFFTLNFSCCFFSFFWFTLAGGWGGGGRSLLCSFTKLSIYKIGIYLLNSFILNIINRKGL